MTSAELVCYQSSIAKIVTRNITNPSLLKALDIIESYVANTNKHDITTKVYNATNTIKQN